MELILEKGNNALPELVAVDRLFAEIKLKLSESKDVSKISKSLESKLESKLETIFGTSFSVQLQSKGQFADNFAVLPIYKRSKEILNNTLDVNSIKLHKVEKVYLLIGTTLIGYSTPRQLTGLLLHDIGHVIEHISRLSAFFLHALAITQTISLLFSFFPIINLVFFPLLIITSRTLNFTNHAKEYNADKFSVRYGYGDELASWCLRHLHEEKNKKHNLESKVVKIISSINEIVMGSSHPSMQKRLIAVIEDMKTNYSTQYKDKRIKDLLDKHYSL